MDGKNENKNQSIETIIENTWKEKEMVPEVAKPIWGGSIKFWIIVLVSNSYVLKQLVKELEGMTPESIIYPHPISGPLHVIQRLDFLRFHMNRHQLQIERVKSNPNYPQS